MKHVVAAAVTVLVPTLALAASANGQRSTRFTVRVENVSTPATLRLSSGESAPAPNAPVLWVVHTRPGVLFSPGHHDPGVGLEALAEDGNPEPLAQHLAAGGEKGVVSSGAVAVPVGDSAPGPALPGKHYEFSFSASPGQRLSLASMFGQSNDVWIGTDEEGIALFGARGQPVTGDVTAKLYLWDAGTEVNEEPGAGRFQAPRQPGPNSGPAEHAKVGRVQDGFTYPAVVQVVKVTLSAQPRPVASR
jgi:hypothetical protein